MPLSHRLELRQSQSLVMTPQLMQAIKLLQLSNLDLIAYVDAELERNPLLERADGDEAADSGESDDGEAALNVVGESDDSAEVAGGDTDWQDTRLDAQPGMLAEKIDTDLSNVFPDDAPQAPGETAPG